MKRHMCGITSTWQKPTRLEAHLQRWGWTLLKGKRMARKEADSSPVGEIRTEVGVVDLATEGKKPIEDVVRQASETDLWKNEA